MADYVEGPRTAAQNSHPLAILDGTTNELIGAVNAWNPRYARQVTELFEFGDVTQTYGTAEGSGEPFEVVPGNVTGQTIEASRWDLFTLQAEKAWGKSFDLGGQLTKQKDAISLVDSWKNLSQKGGSAPGYRNIFSGVWATTIGRTLQATADRAVNVTASFAFTKRRREESAGA